jgi:predicted transcriptional regulator
MKVNHVNQVAAFEQLLGFCNAHGAVFNPSKNVIKMTALDDLLKQAQESMRAVKEARTANDNAVIARRQAFRELPKIATRIINALAATDASAEVVQKANAFRMSLLPKANRPPVPSTDAGSSTDPEAKSRSISMLSFTQKTDNFAALVQTLSAEAHYQPNEAGIQIRALVELVAALRDYSKAVYQSEVALSNARFARNKLLYGTNGIHECSQTVKKYMKSVFGPQSVPFRQINRLRFADKKF